MTEPHIKTIAWHFGVNDRRDGRPRRLPAGSLGCPEMAPPTAPRKHHDFNEIKNGARRPPLDQNAASACG